MSKIAIINDTHFGVRNSSNIFLENSKLFFTEIFFPYCEENNVKSIIHLGDFFDDRKHINIKVFNEVNKFFLSELERLNITMHIIIGNHDVYYKENNELNSLRLFLSNSDNVKLYETAQDILVENFSFGVVPWITKENYDKSLEFIKNDCHSPILLGHFDIAGFSMMKNGPASKEGLTKSLFNEYDYVFSGHFHTKSIQDNIIYFGSQMQFTWADVNEKKYFHVFDTKTHDIIPIKNYYPLFYKICYNSNKEEDIEYYKDEIKNNPDVIENKFIKIFVLKKGDLYQFDKFVEFVNYYKPYELKIEENFQDYLTNIDINDRNDAILDTTHLLNEYIEDLNIEDNNIDVDDLKKLAQEVYVEALNNYDNS